MPPREVVLLTEKWPQWPAVTAWASGGAGIRTQAVWPPRPAHLTVLPSCLSQRQGVQNPGSQGEVERLRFCP